MDGGGAAVDPLKRAAVVLRGVPPGDRAGFVAALRGAVLDLTPEAATSLDLDGEVALDGLGGAASPLGADAEGQADVVAMRWAGGTESWRELLGRARAAVRVGGYVVASFEGTATALGWAGAWIGWFFRGEARPAWLAGVGRVAPGAVRREAERRGLVVLALQRGRAHGARGLHLIATRPH